MVPVVAVNSAEASFTNLPAASNSRTFSGSVSPAAICASAGTTCTQAGSPAGALVASDTCCGSGDGTISEDEKAAALSPRQ